MASAQTIQTEPARRQATIVLAWLASVTANVIHNNLGVDPVIAPATIFLALYLWRPGRALLWATAVFIALPSFLFLKMAALTSPTDVKPFMNHLALLVGGVLAVASIGISLKQPQ